MSTQPTAITGGSLYNLRVPMPIPRTQDAPFFNERYIEDFLNRIVQHGTNAGITDVDDLVKYIVEYSSDKVKDLILYMEEFDPDRPGKTWKKAKDALLLLYGSMDKPKEYTEEELKLFCQNHSAKSGFTKTSDIETYYREFVPIAASLKKQGIITDTEFNLYFVKGIPGSLKDWFASAVPERNRTWSNPPTAVESLKILKTKFDKDSIIYEDWKHEEDTKAKSDFDDNGNRVVTAYGQQDGLLVDARIPGEPTKQSVVLTSRPGNVIDDLSKRMESLTLMMTAMQEREEARNKNPRQNQGSDPSSPPCCFMCGQAGTHQLGLRFCPETNKLVAERLVTFSVPRNKYILPDGQDLPRVPYGWVGGVASFIRQQTGTVSNRDAPPHLPNTGVVGTVGLMYDDTEILTGNTFALETVSSDYVSNPTTRSGRDTTNRFDPINRPDRGKPAERAPNNPPTPTRQSIPQPQSVPQPTRVQPPPQQQVRFAPEPIPIPNKVNVPQPPNPINNEQGWKSSRPGNPRGGAQDVEMKDGESRKQANSGPQYHFTSKIQDYANPDNIFAHIGGMKVEVPLFQLLGLSPQLSKMMSENTRTRREYGPVKEGTTRSAEYSSFIEDFGFDREVTEVLATRGPDSGESHAYVEEGDSTLKEFVFRCNNAAIEIPKTRLFAMTVGDVRLTLNGVEFLAMLDSGSELNVAGSHLPEAASLPMDFDGMRWKLKGINGDYERLRGCIIEAPIRIGGHDFSHHIFVSQQSIGRHDIILGQPFLQWFSSRMDYDRGSHAKLYLWADGDKSRRPTLMISITDPNSSRNAAAIKGLSNATSYIEEVESKDFRR